MGVAFFCKNRQSQLRAIACYLSTSATIGRSSGDQKYLMMSAYAVFLSQLGES